MPCAAWEEGTLALLICLARNLVITVNHLTSVQWCALLGDCALTGRQPRLLNVCVRSRQVSSHLVQGHAVRPTTPLHCCMARLCLLAISSPCWCRPCTGLAHLTPQASLLVSCGLHRRLSLALCLHHLCLQSLHCSALLVQQGLLLLQAV